MTIRDGSVRQSTMLAAAILLGIVAALNAGCASNERRSAQEATTVQSPEALCRQAIADVSEHCNAEDSSARQCETAKTRSRELCI